MDDLPGHQQKLVQAIRKLIEQTVPMAEEKLSYNIPFYHYRGRLCYINPSKEGVDLCFCRGKKLAEAFPQLMVKNRVEVATVPIQKLTDLETLSVASLLTAAALLNEEGKKTKTCFHGFSAKAQ